MSALSFSRCLFCNLLFLGAYTLNAQSTKCVVLCDAESRQPIPFATVISTGFGAYTDSLGRFCSNENVADTFLASCIGYKEKKINMGASADNDTFFLEPAAMVLPEIEIGKYGWLLNASIEQIGLKNTKQAKFTNNVVEGVTIVKFFPNPDTTKEFIISTFSMRVSHSSEIYKPRKIRLKIFEPDKAGKPGADIIQTADILTIEKPASDYVHFDLNRYAVKVPARGYFIGVEFLTPKLDESDAGLFSVLGKLSRDFENGEVYIRYFTNVFRPYTFSSTQKVNVFFNTRLYENK